MIFLKIRNVFHRNPIVIYAAVLACLLLNGQHQLLAQDTKSPNRGFQPGGSYALSDIETINKSNGNVLLNIPLASLPAGPGGSPGARVNLVYNSKVWDAVTYYIGSSGGPPPVTIETNLVPSPDGGWKYGYQYTLDLENRLEHRVNFPNPGDCSDPSFWHIFRLKMSFPDGSVHVFRPYGFENTVSDGEYFNITPDGYVLTCGGETPPSGGVTKTTYYSTDGTFLRLEFTVDYPSDPSGNWGNNAWTLYFPDGSRVTGGNAPQRIYDRNGNYTDFFEIDNYNGTGHQATQIIDQVNRSILIEYAAAPNEDHITVKGTVQEDLLWKVRWRQIAVNKQYDGGPGVPIRQLANYLLGVDQIILPTQAGTLSYGFNYNAGPTFDQNPSFGWGELSSITLPTLASAQYQYTWDGQGSGPGFLTYAQVLANAITQKQLTYNEEADGAVTPKTEVWAYTIVPNQSSVITAPDGGQIQDWFIYWDIVKQGLNYKSDQPDGTIIERIWQDNTPQGAKGSFANFEANHYVKTEFISKNNGSGVHSVTAIKDYQYDKNGNLTQLAEYDWIPYGDVPRDGSNKPTGAIPASAQVKKVTFSEYFNPTPVASDYTTVAPNTYRMPDSPQLRNAVASSELRSSFSAAAALSRTEFTYDNPATTGNITQQTTWDSTKAALTRPLQAGNSISVAHQYSPSGNRTLTTDARGFQTAFDYGPINSVSDLYVTEMRVAQGTPEQRKTQYDYDFYAGVETLVKDVDNNITNLKGYDAFRRPSLLQEAVGTPDERRTETTYSDVNRRVITRSDLTATADLKLVQVQHFDPLGRIRLSRTLEDASTSDATNETTGIKVQTRYRYSGSNSFQLVSNPYRAGQSGQAGGEATMGWTLTTFDQGGRVVGVESLSGAAVPAPWGSNSASTGTVLTVYDAEFTTVTDQAGKLRRSRVDGLARLARVDEPNGSGDLGSVSAPNQATYYDYDALGNLGSVTQGGQVRTFSYSSLSRLLSASNPESGAVSYQYDPNGNLTQKTEARGVVKTFAPYDGLNRVKGWSYSGGPASAANTPAVTLNYDVPGVPATPNFPKGQLTSVSSSASVTHYDVYDALGRVKQNRQVTDGQIYGLSYEYNRPGTMTQQIYPSGRTVTTAVDTAGRVNAVAGQNTGGLNKTYASLASYAAHGGMASLKLGNNLWEHTNFNERLQPVEIGLGNTAASGEHLVLTYTYLGGCQPGNNGNVLSQAITLQTPAPATLTQTYCYDPLNRLNSAGEVTNTGGNQWSHTYAYDRFGNRAASSNLPMSLLTPTQLTDYNASTNRLVQVGNRIPEYDATGNLTKDTESPANIFEYDAENRLVTFNSGAAHYTYDGDGRRVKKDVGTKTTIFVYNTAGQLAAEYATAPEASASVSYLTSDPLGSTRIVTDSAGAVKTRHDFYPFGEEIPGSVGNRSTLAGYPPDLISGPTQKFTAKERDSESNLDYFGARYFSGAQGRFTGPDDIFNDMEPADPATWNRYAYVRNNPLRYVDPNGEDAWDVVNGIVNAVGSNGLLGAGRVESGNADFKTGQAIGDAISVVVGMAETDLGAGGNIIGFSLDATGAGAVLGVPINVVSTGAMLHGAGMSTMGTYHLSKSAGEQDTTTQGARSNSSESSGRYSGRYADGEKAQRTNVPRDPKTGVPAPDSKAQGPHSRLQSDAKKPGRVYSATEFNAQGQPVKRIDFAGRKGQPVPHQHRYDPQKKTFRKEHEPLQQ